MTPNSCTICEQLTASGRTLLRITPFCRLLSRSTRLSCATCCSPSQLLLEKKPDLPELLSHHLSRHCPGKPTSARRKPRRRIRDDRSSLGSRQPQAKRLPPQSAIAPGDPGYAGGTVNFCRSRRDRRTVDPPPAGKASLVCVVQYDHPAGWASPSRMQTGNRTSTSYTRPAITD
jgi:hypothetical protein